MLFLMVANQIGKGEQNSLIMARLMKLLEGIKVPKEDEDHVRMVYLMIQFFKKLGQVTSKLLSMKEFSAFFQVLFAFVQWAKTSQLTQLSFMVPRDEEVQKILGNFIATSRISTDSKLKPFNTIQILTSPNVKKTQSKHI